MKEHEFIQQYLRTQPPEVVKAVTSNPKGATAKSFMRDAARAWRKKKAELKESSGVKITGEYWLLPDGAILEADGDNNNNHEDHVAEAILGMIFDFLGQDWDGGADVIMAFEVLNDSIYPDRYGWEEEDPHARLRKEMVEGGYFNGSTLEAEAAFKALNSNNDARAFAINVWRWIRVAGSAAELPNLHADTLVRAGNGLGDILSNEGIDDNNAIETAVMQVSTYGGRGGRHTVTIKDLLDGSLRNSRDTWNDTLTQAARKQVDAMDQALVSPFYKGRVESLRILSALTEELSEHQDRRFIGGVYQQGEVRGVEVPAADWPNIEHNSGAIPYSWRARWRYRDGVVRWTREAPEPEDLHAVDNWLVKKGVAVDEHVDFFGVKLAEALSGSEAVFGFAGWLTTRPTPVTMCDTCDCSMVVKLVSAFLDANNLEEPRDHWEKDLKHPDEEDLSESSEIVRRLIRVVKEFQDANPYPDYGDLYWHPERKYVLYNVGDGQEGDLEELRDRLARIAGVEEADVDCECGRPEGADKVWSQHDA